MTAFEVEYGKFSADADNNDSDYIAILFAARL
jgi:hypothetical protein